MNEQGESENVKGEDNQPVEQNLFWTGEFNQYHMAPSAVGIKLCLPCYGIITTVKTWFWR